MATSYLVIRTVDVLGNPLDAKRIRADFGNAVVWLDRVSPGIAEGRIPPDATDAHVQILANDPYWDTFEHVTVGVSGTPPTIGFVGDAQLTSVGTAAVSRGDDFNLELHAVLCQLRDATDMAQQYCQNASTRDETPAFARYTTGQLAAILGSNSFPASNCPHSSTPILNPSGSAWTLLNTTVSAGQFQGRLFFAERKRTPRLIVLGHPGWNKPANATQATLPIPVHVFYTPRIFWHEPYPWGPSYMDFVYRYLVEAAMDVGGKGMLLQNSAGGPTNVFVFPVGNPEQLAGDMADQAGALRILHEAVFLMQRQLGVLRPLQPLGSISVSCFSEGVLWMADMLMGTSVPAFQSALRNVFLFDGTFGSLGAGKSSRTAAFAAWLARWHQRNRMGSLRVYTQEPIWLDHLQPALRLPKIADGPAGAQEFSTGHATILYAPTELWRKIVPGSEGLSALDVYYMAHQIFPSFFMEHAVTNSTFASAFAFTS